MRGRLAGDPPGLDCAHPICIPSNCVPMKAEGDLAGTLTSEQTHHANCGPVPSVLIPSFSGRAQTYTLSDLFPAREQCFCCLQECGGWHQPAGRRPCCLPCLKPTRWGSHLTPSAIYGIRRGMIDRAQINLTCDLGITWKIVCSTLLLLEAAPVITAMEMAASSRRMSFEGPGLRVEQVMRGVLSATAAVYAPPPPFILPLPSS